MACRRVRFGVGPKRHMLARRLTNVRRELRQANRGSPTIADVANRWGFGHMGQFAVDFRPFFGVLSSRALSC